METLDAELVVGGYITGATYDIRIGPDVCHEAIRLWAPPPGVSRLIATWALRSPGLGVVMLHDDAVDGAKLHLNPAGLAELAVRVRQRVQGVRSDMPECLTKGPGRSGLPLEWRAYSMISPLTDRLVPLSTYLALTDRICADQDMALEPGEVASLEREAGGWCLRTRHPAGKLWLYPPTDSDDWRAALEAVTSHPPGSAVLKP